MHTITRLAVSAILVTSALAAIHQSSAKLRRDGVLNLYPFPRVGRGSLHQTWQLPLNDLYIEYKPTQKRSLYAFPRVGRNGPSYLPQLPLTLEQLILESRNRAFSKRAIEVKSEKDPGMWFGPRLGRSLKEDALNDSDSSARPENSNEVSEPEEADQIEQTEDTRQKRQV